MRIAAKYKGLVTLVDMGDRGYRMQAAAGYCFTDPDKNYGYGPVTTCRQMNASGVRKQLKKLHKIQ